MTEKETYNFEPNKKLSGVLGQIYDEYIKQNLSLEDARKLQVKINAEYQKYKNHPTKSNKYFTRSVAIKAYIDYLLTNTNRTTTTTNFKTLIVNILSQNGYTNGKDYKIRYFKSSPYRANRGEKNIQECWLTVRNAPTNVAVAEDDFDDIESLTNYVCGLVDSKWSSKKKAKQATTFHVGDLICYKGVEESVFKIVGFKGNNYLVVEIGDRTKTENKIPFADNDKLQRAVSPLLLTEAELAKIEAKQPIDLSLEMSDEDKAYIRESEGGIITENDFAYLEYNVKIMDYYLIKDENDPEVTAKDRITAAKAIELLGRELFWSGIFRAAYHGTALRAKDYSKPPFVVFAKSRNLSGISGINDFSASQVDYLDLSAASEGLYSKNMKIALPKIKQYYTDNLLWKSFYNEHKGIIIDVTSDSFDETFWGLRNGKPVYFTKELILGIHFLPELIRKMKFVGKTKCEKKSQIKIKGNNILAFEITVKFGSKLCKFYVPVLEINDGKTIQYSIRIKNKKTLSNTAVNNGSTSLRGIGEEFSCAKIKQISDTAKQSDIIKQKFNGLGTSTPTKITDKGDDFSYFDYPKDVIDKFYTYIRISNLDKYIPAYSNYFFDEDGHLCFPTRRTQDIIDCVDIDRCLKGYEDLKHEWIAKAEDNINGFIWQFFINDTEFSPRGSYNYKILNRDLVELLLGYARKFEETSEIYPDKLGVENLQDYNNTKEILTKRLAELNKPKQTKKPPTIPTIQPERLLKFDRNRLYMSCVHCVRGYKFYSDAHFLLKLKSDYPKSYEGKNVMPKHFFKKFEEFIINPEKVLFYDEGAYPVADAVIYSTLSKIKYSVPIDIQSLYQYLCDLTDYYEKQTGEEVKDFNRHLVPIFYNGQHAFTMDIVRLKQILSAAKLINADTIKWVDYSYAVVLQNSKSDNGEILLIMPHYRDETPTITDGKCQISVDWDIWYKPYDLADTRKSNILITEAKLCTLKQKSEKRTPPPTMSEIVAMLDSHEFSGEPYTEADKEKLSQYQGIGGKGKEVGAQSGILNQYYTPVWVCECMYKLAKKYGFKGGSILEPSAATGNMIKPFYDRGDYNHIDAFEIDKLTAKICKILYPDVEVMNQYFETAFLEYPRFTSKARKPWLKNYPYDLVIGNPPYGVHKNLYSGYFTGKDHFQQIEMFFIYKALQLLKTGGLLIYITSINFMSTGLKTYAAAKKQIGEIAEFVDAYRLPSVFDNTPICTDIIVLRKK